LWARKGLLLLLFGASILLLLLFILPFWKIYAWMFQTLASGDPSAISNSTPPENFRDYIFFIMRMMILWVPLIGYLSSILYAIWTRASILPSSEVFEGGIKKVLTRGLRVFWRSICGFGWAVLFLFGMMLLFMIFGSSLIPNPETIRDFSNPYQAIPWPMYLIDLVMLVLFGILFFAWMVSIHGEARNVRLPIHEGLGLLGGHLIKALLLAFVITLILLGWIYAAEIIWAVDFFGTFKYQDPDLKTNLAEIFTTKNIILFGVLYLVALLFYTLHGFAIATLGAIYASKLHPDLGASNNKNAA